MEKIEIWKDVGGYEKLYQVSNLGNIRNKRNFKLKKPELNQGYLRVSLYKDGVGKHFRVNRLVATSFIDNEFNLPCVNHKDEDKLNNGVLNLEWCTHKYNSNYGTNIQRRVANTNYKESTRLALIKMHETTRKPIVQLDKNYKETNRYNSISQASEITNINLSNIAQVCQGNRKSAGGFAWEYVEGSVSN